MVKVASLTALALVCLGTSPVDVNPLSAGFRSDAIRNFGESDHSGDAADARSTPSPDGSPNHSPERDAGSLPAGVSREDSNALATSDSAAPLVAVGDRAGHTDPDFPLPNSVTDDDSGGPYRIVVIGLLLLISPIAGWLLYLRFEGWRLAKSRQRHRALHGAAHDHACPVCRLTSRPVEALDVTPRQLMMDRARSASSHPPEQTKRLDAVPHDSGY